MDETDTMKMGGGSLGELANRSTGVRSNTEMRGTVDLRVDRIVEQRVEAGNRRRKQPTKDAPRVWG